MKRVDQNQPEIVAALRAIGAEWIHTSEDTRSGCDGVVCFRGRQYVSEIKNGDLPASRQKLTENEEKTKAKCEKTGSPYLILTSPEQAIELLMSLQPKGGE